MHTLHGSLSAHEWHEHQISWHHRSSELAVVVIVGPPTRMNKCYMLLLDLHDMAKAQISDRASQDSRLRSQKGGVEFINFPFGFFGSEICSEQWWATTARIRGQIQTGQTGSTPFDLLGPQPRISPWGRPPFGALMQLCFCMARGLPVSSTHMLSNRAEKTVCPPGPCGTLEFAVPDAGNQAGAVLAVVARLRRVRCGRCVCARTAQSVGRWPSCS